MGTFWDFLLMFPKISHLKEGQKWENFGKNTKMSHDFSQCRTGFLYNMVLHREEPPQNPDKSAIFFFFFQGNFYMVGIGIEKSLI